MAEALADNLQIIETSGARVRWVKSALEQAGVQVQRVSRAPNGLYHLTIAAEDAPGAAEALLPIQNYRKRRPPAEVTAIQALTGAGIAVAGLAALVSPAGGALMLALAGFTWYVLKMMRQEAETMRQAGGWYGMAAGLGMLLALLLVALCFAAAGGMALVQISQGNSALKLIGW